MRLWILLAGLGLAGCAVTPATPPSDGATARPASPESFHMSGRVSVRNQEQTFSGGITWHRRHSEEVVRLSTPLGQGVVEVRMGSAGAELIDAEGQGYAAADAEALLQAILGWTLPLHGLGHWIAGRPDPAQPFTGQADDLGRWLNLTQAGWRIDFARYGDGVLPGRVLARRGETLEIRLVVDAWQVQ